MSKNVIIVGASSGIGEALALEFAKQGYRIGITARRGEKLHAIKTKAPTALHILESDVTKEQAIADLERLVETLGGLDLFVFSAGVNTSTTLLNMDWRIKLINSM